MQRWRRRWFVLQEAPVASASGACGEDEENVNGGSGHFFLAYFSDERAAR